MVNRRQFLTGAATAGTVAIAGCSSAPLIGDGGPEDAVEQFFTATRNGDVEAANEVLHPESRYYPAEEDDLVDGNDSTVTDTNQVSTRELAEWEIERFSGSVDEASEEEIEENTEGLQQLAEEQADGAGADDFAWVLVTIERDGEEQDFPVLTVQDDGDWYVLS